MDLDNYFYLGKVVRKHGYKGDIMLLIDADDPLEYSNIEGAFFLLKGRFTPYIFTKIEHKKDNLFLAHIQGIDTEEALGNILRSEIYLPISLLKPLGDESFYYHEVVGYTVIDSERGEIGVLEEIITQTAQDVGVIRHESEREILIPLVDEIFTGFSRDQKELYVSSPPGLIDLYLEL